MKYNLNEKIAERKTKEVYKDGDKTIKLFVPNYSKADILNEALIQSRVEEGSNLNIPKLIEVTKIDDRWALVSEHIEGKTLCKVINENKEDRSKYLELFVDIQLEVLSKNIPLLNRMKDKYRRKLTDSNLLDENTKYELLQRLEGMKNHTKLCHGDFNPTNVIIKEDGSYAVIDWSHATQGNASSDAANTYLEFNLCGSCNVADEYLSIFSRKSGIEKENIQKWIPIVAAILLEKHPENKEKLEKYINVVDFD